MDTIILADDGRHVTVGRYSKPAEEDIAYSAAEMLTQGVGGWLVRLDGEYYSRRKPVLTHIRDLTPTSVSFDEAVIRFERLRRAR